MIQWVKDLALSLQQLRSLLWGGFNPWLGKFHMPQVQTKKKKKVHINNIREPILEEFLWLAGGSMNSWLNYTHLQ